MDVKTILSKCDHTLLSQQSTFEQIKALLDDCLKYKTASACIPPCFVKQAKDYVGEGVKICTVIGFPNGYNTTKVKVFEIQDAIKNGADEIDMVINIGALICGDYDYVYNEIVEIKNVCKDKILKVIIETCLLNEEQKIKACELVTKANADYIKTSTGFSTGGATFDDVALLRKHVGKNIKVKAAGGISNLEDAKKFISIGADRLGTSRVVKAVKAMEDK